MNPPISIYVSYNNQNAISDSNLSDQQINRTRQNRSRPNIIRPSTYDNGEMNKHNIGDFNNSNYGKVSWSTTSDYYVPGIKNLKKLNKKQYFNYREFQNDYEQKNENTNDENCPACPLLANRPWSNYKSGDN